MSTQAFPNRTVCVVESTFETQGTIQGSGIIVSSNLVLTAGHCVYDTDNHEWATSIKVTPGRVSTLEPYGFSYASEFSTSEAYINSGNVNGDWGIIKLANNLGNQTGWVRNGCFNRFFFARCSNWNYGISTSI